MKLWQFYFLMFGLFMVSYYVSGKELVIFIAAVLMLGASIYTMFKGEHNHE